MSGKKLVILIGVVAIFVLIVIFSSWYSVNEGERGVLLTNGKVTDIESSGLHFKAPFFQSVAKISTRTQTVEGAALAMYSFDQQTAMLQVSVTFHVAPEQVRQVYTQYGSVEGLFYHAIQPRLHEVSKSVFGQFTAARAIQEREKLNSEMNMAIKEALTNVPAVIENIQIENVDFSDTYERAVEEAAKAKADVERAKSELARVEQEAQQKVKNAEAEAAATKARADAEAHRIKVMGEAEAEAIRQRGAALRDNPQIIEPTKAEQWNGVLPSTMLPGSAVPFISVK